VRDAVRLLQQLGVRPAQAGRRDDRGPFGKAAFRRAIEKLVRGIEPRGIMQMRQIEDEIGPLLARRQVVARKRVDVGCRSHCVSPAASIALPMMSCWTSVAPS